MKKWIFLVLTVNIILQIQAQDTVIISTKNGEIEGFLGGETSKGREYYTFHKIPFAKPPIGELRFKDPVPTQNWDGVRNGSMKPIMCPMPDLGEYFSTQEKAYIGDEDCLHLSIYVPKRNESTKQLPVMFYIHGGAFIAGTGSIHGPEELLNENIILVTTNYRLGVLGFLSTEDEIMPGNFGLKDQVMALKWTKENIQSFGGDADSITIFGESAGSASVHFLILSPYAKGLFQRAIMQSGTSLCPWTHSINQRSIADQIGASVGCYTPSTIGETQSKNLMQCLQNVSAEDLIMTFDNFVLWSYLPAVFVPRVDGDFIPDEPETLLRNGQFNIVDTIIGVTKDEGGLFTYGLYAQDSLQANRSLSNLQLYKPISLGLNYENSAYDIASEVYDYYLPEGILLPEMADNYTNMYGDRHFAICSDLVALDHSEHAKVDENKVWFYEYSYKSSVQQAPLFQNVNIGQEWVSHAEDLLSLFQFPFPNGTIPERSQGDEAVRDIMTKLWTNFATTGNPTPDSSLGFKWVSFTKESTKHLSITTEPKMTNDRREEERRFWKTLPLKENELLFS